MTHKKAILLLLTIAAGPLCGSLRAAPRLADVFQDGMVLQRDTDAKIWGTAEAGEAIAVDFREKNAQTKADADGKWVVALPTGEAGGPFTLKVTGRRELTVQDVLVGEVWIASGQSNMAFTVRALRDAPAVIAAANDPELRFFTVGTATADTPQATLHGKWEAATPQAAGSFSAVAYYFAKVLRGELKVPVGILSTSWGGTGVTSWISKEAFEPLQVSKAVYSRWEKVLQDYPKRSRQYEMDLAAWDAERVEAKKSGAPFSRKKPIPPPGSPGFRNVPHGLFNAMINPLVPYAIRGAIWYQGEGNTPFAKEYGETFGAMIGDWRKRFGQGDFPFLYVQLAAFIADDKRDWPALRQAQADTLRLPNTGMAVAFDVGERDDIHPKNKKVVGDRLAAIALNKVYGLPRPDAGPRPLAVKREGAALVVEFDPMFGAVTGRTPEKLAGFEISGADGSFVPADAALLGKTVRVSSAAVADPVAVRYLWKNYDEASLFNTAGFPAAPFSLGAVASEK